MVAVPSRPHRRDAESGRQWLAARLPRTELRLLDRQGFVSRERLPSGTTCAKLRFRDGTGRQRVVYLGVGPVRAEQIAAYLAERQAQVRRRRALNQLRRRGRRLLRQVKPRLAPHIKASEWHFHGRQLRRKRRCAEAETTTFILHNANTKGLSMTQAYAVQPTDRPTAITATSGSQHDGMRQWAQSQDSPFDAAVGYLTADLCDLAAGFAAPLKAALQATPAATLQHADLVEEARFFLQLSRQAERCLRLAPRVDAHPSRAKKSAVDTDVLVAPTPPPAASIPAST
ncbi:MAG: hypothetical protein C0485_17740 [Pirellula sp.]|nr:hypothetical protein [Pirellula sp.]